MSSSASPDGGLSPRLWSMLGIEAPILQSGMGGVAGPELVAAVSNAGGLGILAALRLPPDKVRAGIIRVRELTDKPFGVNVWLHDDVRHAIDPAALDGDVVRRAQSVLNEARNRFDLSATLRPPPAVDHLVNDALEVMIEERVPVFSAAIGLPEADLVDRFHTVGTKVLSMVASADDARIAVANGADVVVAQGTEAGGHRSYGQKHDAKNAVGTSTLTLVPETVDAVGQQVPVVAAGGVVDGRGLAAMLALGAHGVLLGTRFVATLESEASDLWKQRLMSSQTQTTLTDGFTGQWARVLRSEFTELWEESGAEPLPGLLQAAIGADLFGAAKSLDDDQYQPLYAGSGAALITDLPAAADVVTTLVAQATLALATPLRIWDREEPE